MIEETGEYDEQRLNHEGGEAERFYRDLKRKGIHVRVGMEDTGYSRWFERWLAELDFELWIGDPAEIEAKRVKKRKTDREDERLLLRLMREDRLPNLGTESGESGSAPTVVAPTSVGADAHADYEPTASAGHERRKALEVEAVEQTWDEQNSKHW